MQFKRGHTNTATCLPPLSANRLLPKDQYSERTPLLKVIPLVIRILITLYTLYNPVFKMRANFLLIHQCVSRCLCFGKTGDILMVSLFLFARRGCVWMCFQLFHHPDEAGPGQLGRFNCKLKMEHFRTFTSQHTDMFHKPALSYHSREVFTIPISHN